MTATEHTFKTWDGNELFYRSWLPEKPVSQALILFHRGHEHSARWQETVDLLALDDIGVFAWDARGHGRSPGERGSAENLAAVIKDVDEFVKHVSAAYHIAVPDMIVLGHSVGAVSMLAWIHDYAPTIRAMVVATPALRVKLYIPFAIPMLRLKQKLAGPGYVKSYVKATMLTHDPEQATAYQADKLIFRQIAVNILLDLHDTSTRLMADAGAFTTPTLLIGAGADWVVSLDAQEKLSRDLSSPIKELEVFPNLYHAVFHEKGREQVVARARKFILQRFAQPPVTASLLDADKTGHTKAEFDRLSAPGGASFAPMRLAMKTLGRLSKGVSTGWTTGFDSGVTLDHVYKNQAEGITSIGRMIDRSFLDSIGWRGIRQRRVHLEKILRDAIESLHQAGKPVRILDIATGGGRYALETMNALRHIPMTAVLRDYQQVNLEAAKKLAGELGLDNLSIVQGDAFDRKSIAFVTPRPTIVIVSGLYELFPANAPLRESLAGIADALEPGGLLIYTNQPWHPEVEFIARVLTNREGQPWIMRRRTQAEMDELVRAAGFKKSEMAIDPWGIFTVSIAKRLGA
ncbi:MAG: bifunctional alpha/beta hydrolase/class I SAM-dependent methyltransferase [Verrucomicrobiota bacterium]